MGRTRKPTSKQSKAQQNAPARCTASNKNSTECIDPRVRAQACREGLPKDELQKLEEISIMLPARDSRNSKQQAAAEKVALEQAQQTLEEHNMCILYNALSESELKEIYAEYEQLLDFTSSSAVGEKDASKRSGTRFFNCACQVGPNCGFEGWRVGSEQSKRVLDLVTEHSRDSVWRRLVTSLGLDHVARVEVVSSHPGCRHQDWHVDAPRGLTVIFALVDVDVPKGPTQMDFTVAHNAILDDQPKIKPRYDPPSWHAAMPAGSVLMFNANCSHRGTANLSRSQRPILVLDCSPQCDFDGASLLYSEPSITEEMAKGQKAA